MKVPAAATIISSLVHEGMHVDWAHLEAYKKRGFSDALINHAVLDQLEGRLKKLDGNHGGRKWEDSWADALLRQPGFQVFQQPYKATAEQREARRNCVASLESLESLESSSSS